MIVTCDQRKECLELRSANASGMHASWPLSGRLGSLPARTSPGGQLPVFWSARKQIVAYNWLDREVWERVHYSPLLFALHGPPTPRIAVEDTSLLLSSWQHHHRDPPRTPPARIRYVLLEAHGRQSNDIASRSPTSRQPKRSWRAADMTQGKQPQNVNLHTLFRRGAAVKVTSAPQGD